MMPGWRRSCTRKNSLSRLPHASSCTTSVWTNDRSVGRHQWAVCAFRLLRAHAHRTDHAQILRHQFARRLAAEQCKIARNLDSQVGEGVLHTSTLVDCRRIHGWATGEHHAGAQRDGFQHVGAAAKAAVDQHGKVESTAATGSGNACKVEIAPSSWHPPWFDTISASCPRCTASAASPACITPFTTSRPVVAPFVQVDRA